MTKVLIDTNIYSLAMLGDPEIVDTLKKAEKIAISSISLGELYSGFKAGKKEKSNRNELNQFLDSPRVEIFYIDENSAEFYADSLYQLKRKGKPIPTNDIWIGASALQHGYKLFTKDNHFKNIQGIILV